MIKKELSPKLVICLFFILFIYLSPALHFLHISRNAPLAEQFEHLPLTSPKALEYFFENHFPARNFLVAFSNRVIYAVFGVSPIPQVIVGQKGWLFQAREGVARPFTPDELEMWSRLIEERFLWLEKRGMAYLFIVVPTKSTLYPEFLPNSHHRALRPARMDQLIQRLRAHTRVPVLDLRLALLPARDQRLLYLKTDSHWNEAGACLAAAFIYQEAASRLFPGRSFPAPLTPGDFRSKVQKNKTGGNLAMLISLENSAFREDRLKLMPRRPLQSHIAPLPNIPFPDTVKMEAAERPSAPLPGAVMLHDSFGRKLKPILAEYFSRILFVRDWSFHFHTAIIAREKPRLVLDEISEHFLYSKVPVNPPEVIKEQGDTNGYQ